ncbi:BTB/POZ domain-containing protein 6-like [Paramacrobiotus metropolitanus]|uniref:BTB/POZ domain-containing protein 6-like n=1 Tax=Paramacrobiotus metropolitanus TaxID=2943436 RepID=UPI002445933F|nr:BTB/POZ domain-containing protein 6-like [Paramacrobiotus metropolitanus]
MAQKSAPFVSSQRRGTVSQASGRWKDALSKSELSDVEFAVGRLCGEVKRFRAHKLTLGISSDVFHTMFYGSLAERCDTAIDIADIPPDAFDNLLRYIYTDAMDNLLPENAVQTLYCADKYDLPWLAERCTDFILNDLDADNCLLYLENALRWSPDCDPVVETCLDVVDASSEAVFQSAHFTQLERKTLERILQRNTLSARENFVYTAVEKWAAAACARKKLSPSPANRRRMLGPALFLVRFALLNEAQLANGPVKSGLLRDKEVSRVLLSKHSTSEEPALEFSVEPRRHFMYRLTSRYTYKPMEKIFILYNNGYWYPATVTGNDVSDFSHEYEMDNAKDKGGIRQRIKAVRAMDILKRGLPVKAYIDGAYKEATYGSLRAGRHTVSVADREYSTHFMELKISRRHVDE